MERQTVLYCNLVIMGVGAVVAARTKEQALGRARTAFTAKVAEARRLERAFQTVFTRANDLVRGQFRFGVVRGDPW